MARHVNEVRTSREPEEVLMAVTDYLQSQNFKEIDVKGEKVWKKGLGLMLGPQYVKFESEPGSSISKPGSGSPCSPACMWVKWASPAPSG